MSGLIFIDSEISNDGRVIGDLGAVRDDNAEFHSANTRAFEEFVADADFICGHNIIHHDLKYIGKVFKSNVS